MNFTWVIADLHGEFDKFEKLLEHMKGNGFDLADPEQKLVQLGDRNDRGPDTYKINEWFRTHQMMFPDQVIVLLGNHDKMMIDAAEGRSDLMYYNGGSYTARSYAHIVNAQPYGRIPDRLFPQALRMSGHLDWLKSLPLYYETPEYFFCHAPIPYEKYRSSPIGLDFRQDEHTLTWSYVDGPTHAWVDPNLIPIEENGNFEGKYKLCFYGHIHGMYNNGKELVVPGIRRHGNAILLDTGCGCHRNGYASALRLPDLQVVTSNGEFYNMDQRINEKVLEEAKRLLGLKKDIPDDKVDF